MEQRKLLPRPDALPRAGPPPSVALAGLPPKRKKAAGRTACDPCRSRKSACDGQRPVCSTCRAKRSDCSYKERDKPRVSDTSTKVLALLRSVSEEEAVELLQRLRATPEPDTESLLSQSTEWNYRGRTPESPYVGEQCLALKATGIELELQARYPIAYPSLHPIDVDNLLLETFPDSLTMPGSPGDIELHSGSADISSSFNIHHTLRERPLLQATDPIRGNSSQTYCDPRLHQVCFRDWTSVTVQDGLAAGAVSFYLETQHPIHGLFDADLFLHDLASGERNFCSPILVNAVLAWSCQLYCAIDPAAAGCTTPLLAEARRLWEEEEHLNTLTSVAAAHLLSMTATCQGRDDVANSFMKQAIDLGRQMGLYGAVEERSAKTWLDNHHDWIRAASHIAWGGYCSITHHYLQTHEPLIERPPHLPIPGEVGAELARSKRDRYDSYPVLFAGQTFNKLCELFRLAHKLLWAYYDGEGEVNDTPSKRVDLPFAEGLFRELLDWSASLPLELVRTEGNTHQTVILHTLFHCLVLDIFRPFKNNTGDLPLKSFEAGDEGDSVGAVYRASVDQLKRLVLYYLSRFSVAAHSSAWLPALVYVLNALIRDVRSSSEQSQTREWNLYFRACMLGLSKQLPFYPMTDKLIRGVLSMAVRDGIMTRAEATKTLEDMRRETGTEGREEPFGDFLTNSGGGASFIVDLDLATQDAAAATADVLVDEFDNLSMLANVASMVIDGR